MALVYTMSWVASTSQWQKRYGKKLYAVSCKQLGLPRHLWTKEGSRQEANAWWQAKQAELDGQAGDAAAERLLVSAADRILAGEDKQAVLMETAKGVLGQEGYDEIVAAAEAKADRLFAPGPPTGRGLSVWVDKWKETLAAKVASGGIDETRRAAYANEIGKFLVWAESQKVVGIDQLTAPILSDLHTHLLNKVGERMEARKRGERGGLSPHYAHSIFATAKQFITWLAVDKDLIALPKNIASKNMRIAIGKKKIKTFGPEEVQALLAAAKAQKPKFYLYLLLMLNAGMYPNDVAELHEGQVDFEKGIVKRPRSKTPNGPVAVYRLWPETLELLKKYRNQGHSPLLDPDDPGSVRVLVTAKGKPLVASGRTDNIRSQYRNLLTNNDHLGGKPLMLLRKTSSSTLGRHKEYGRYAQYFLAQSPRSIADSHYVKPSVKRFFRALRWLGRQYGLVPKEEPKSGES